MHERKGLDAAARGAAQLIASFAQVVYVRAENSLPLARLRDVVVWKPRSVLIYAILLAQLQTKSVIISECLK